MAKVPSKSGAGVPAPQYEPIPGLEGVEQDMLIIPRLKLVQKMSVETDEGIPAGSIVNSVTKDTIGVLDKSSNGSKVTIIPILNGRSRVLYTPIEEGAGWLCSSPDGKYGTGMPGGECAICPKSQWIRTEKGTKAPECTEYFNIYCLVRDYDSPVPLVASFGRTSAQAGRQLINFFYMAAQRERKSPWNFAYQLSTQFTKNELGAFHVFKVTPAGEAKKEEIEQGEMSYKLLKEFGERAQIHTDIAEMEQEREKAKSEPEESEPSSENNEDAPF